MSMHKNDNKGALGIAWRIQVISSLKVNDFVHNWFIDLGNPFQVIMHYLLIGVITCLNHQDEFPIVSALVCIGVH